MTNKTTMCESCLMPLAKDPLGDKRESERYCSYCFHDGKLVYEGSNAKEFRRKMYEAIRARGVNPITASFYTFMTRFASRWKK